MATTSCFEPHLDFIPSSSLQPVLMSFMNCLFYFTTIPRPSFAFHASACPQLGQEPRPAMAFSLALVITRHELPNSLRITFIGLYRSVSWNFNTVGRYCDPANDAAGDTHRDLHGDLLRASYWNRAEASQCLGSWNAWSSSGSRCGVATPLSSLRLRRLHCTSGANMAKFPVEHLLSLSLSL